MMARRGFLAYTARQPFHGASIPVLLPVTYVSGLSLWLPRLFLLKDRL